MKEISKDPPPDSNLKELKEELDRIVKRHEASTTKVEEVKTKLAEELTNSQPPEAPSSDKLDASREELLWKSIFGKDSRDTILDSATSQYLPVGGTFTLSISLLVLGFRRNWRLQEKASHHGDGRWATV